MPKETLKYFFSVEGETEFWYFGKLHELINQNQNAQFSVKFDCKIQKNPLKRAKGLISLGKTVITHVCDFESEEPGFRKRFEDTLSLMKDAQSSHVGKRLTYNLGYSNFAFELWMVLHKADCNALLTNRHQYLKPINDAFQENFRTLDQYKSEQNFNRILNKIKIQDVQDAICRSKQIMRNNANVGYSYQQFKGYKFYSENPSLSIWESIEKILNDCGIM